jgi:DNA-binding MarR family transcriptional regulator
VQYGLLVIAGQHPGTTQQQLAELARIDPSSMVALIDGSRRPGLPSVAPQRGPAQAQIHLTAHGERMLARARESPSRSATCCPADCGRACQFTDGNHRADER